MDNNLDLSTYSHSFSKKNKIARIIWTVVYLFFFRPFATRIFKRWRVLVLKLFGSKIDWSSHVYASVKIWAPWNLELGKNSCLGPKVECYNQGRIYIGENTIISQKVYLCASTHNYKLKDFPLILKPITIGNGVWVASAAFIGPSVNIGNDAVVAAKAVVIKNIEKSTIVGGNPAKLIKTRTFE